jgi:hypothetical protein
VINSVINLVRGKYRSITLAENTSLLQDVDKKSESKEKLALKYGISNSSLSSIIKDRVKTEESFYKFKDSISHQRSRTTRYEELGEKLYQFFFSKCVQQTYKLQVNSDDFRASNGWIEGFKNATILFALLFAVMRRRLKYWTS